MGQVRLVTAAHTRTHVREILHVIDMTRKHFDNRSVPKKVGSGY